MKGRAKTGRAMAVLSPESLSSLRPADAAGQIMQTLCSLPPSLRADTLTLVVWALARRVAPLGEPLETA